ncbi:BTAD domain-containing putative transcriptional regulator [Saccharomonospora xinjiangensis]|uniref:BTAD domain-containing putative transcriptional regulator n=1 Tax=Saccharomonospora xinjiangensis TaxID=75294 RepID=UPI00350F5207
MATTAPDPSITTPPAGARRLTTTELRVLRAVGRGLNDSEIAAELGCPVAAVRQGVERLRAGLGLRDRCALVVYAFDHGIVSPAGPRHGQRPAHGRPTPSPALGPAPAGPPLRLCALGPLRAWAGATPLDLGPARQQAVLAALALRPGVPVSRRELLNDVWGLSAPEGNVVQVYVYRLRKCLGGGRDPVIDRDRAGYRFSGDGADLDVTRLDELTAEAGTAWRAGDFTTAVEAHRRALDLFAGEPLSGLPGPFADMVRLRLTERRLTLAIRRAEGLLRLGRHTQAIDELRAGAVEHPHSEPVAELLMRALYVTGRRADAVSVFTRVRELLLDDLGVEPGERLRHVHTAILRDELPLAPVPHPVRRSA